MVPHNYSCELLPSEQTDPEEVSSKAGNGERDGQIMGIYDNI